MTILDFFYYKVVRVNKSFETPATKNIGNYVHLYNKNKIDIDLPAEKSLHKGSELWDVFFYIIHGYTFTYITRKVDSKCLLQFLSTYYTTYLALHCWHDFRPDCSGKWLCERVLLTMCLK